MATSGIQAPNRRRTTFKENAAEAYAMLKRRGTKDWAAAVKEPPQSPYAGLYYYSFSAYRIDWAKTKQWLERRFPGDKYKEELQVKVVSMTEDNLICYTPELLLEIEVEDIKEKCKMTDLPSASVRRRCQSPEMRA